MLDWIWVSGALQPLCRIVNFIGGCTGGTSNWGEVISGLQKRTFHRIS
jgi:hypothetical protein